ncbi:MAG: signal peptidase II [Acidobacteriota bacterium]|nr:signal peptidase II [Acidobacteriota bacterium]
MPERRAMAYGLAALVVAADRLTKWLVESHVTAADTIRVIPGFFDIIHSQNRGVAFGILNDSQSSWRTSALVALSIAAVIFIGVLLWRPEKLSGRSVWGLALVLGGAAGNLVDRMVWGRVTDFLEVYVGEYHWPTFNLADSAIVIGSGLLILDMLRPKRQAANVP